MQIYLVLMIEEHRDVVQEKVIAVFELKSDAEFYAEEMQRQNNQDVELNLTRPVNYLIDEWEAGEKRL